QCSCKPSGTLPDKHPALRVPIPSGATPGAIPPDHTAAPIPRRPRGYRAAPRAPEGCRQFGSDLTCGSALGAAAFHYFVQGPHSAIDCPVGLTVPPGRFWLPRENTCQPEIVLPTRRPASLCPRYFEPFLGSVLTRRPPVQLNAGLRLPGPASSR